MYRDITAGKDIQVRAVIAEIVAAEPDVIALQRFDWDLQSRAVTAFQARLADAGWPMPHAFAPRPNSGVQTGVDVNSDGRLGRAADAQGYGRFAGQRGMVILSRHPIDRPNIQNFSDILWADIPDTRSQDAPALAALQRLSSVAHIQVPILVAGKPVQILTFHATPPVFDGPEDRNGRRNADEIGFWASYVAQVSKPFVVMGNANLDPKDGEGLKDAIRSLLANPHLQDPKPHSAGAIQNADPDHSGNPAFDTADWEDGKPGNLRVSYVLPSSDLNVARSGVAWDVGQDNTASRHRLVWVDVTFP